MNGFIMIRKHILGSVLILAALGLPACDAAQNQLKTDRSGGLEKQDYRDALAPRELASDEFFKPSDQNAIPELKPYISSSMSQSKSMPLVSISVNRSVPLRDIFYQLAEQADYDIELDPRIRGSIIFSARQRPFDKVVERICDVAGLRYKFEDDVLRVQLDTPYNKSYKIDYLSYVRSNSSQISTDVSVVSGDGANTGSSFTSSSESESDFWGELQENLSLILSNENDNKMLTGNDPEVSVIQQNANLQPVAEVDENGNVVVAPPDAIIQVQDSEDPSADADAAEEPSSSPRFVINKQAGLINVFASEESHEEIQDYLTKLERAVTSQVLIEAKILEVFLRDEYATGIDWRAIDLSNGEVALNYLTTTGASLLDNAPDNTRSIDAPPPGVTGTNSNFVVGYVGNDVQALVRAVAQYGTIKALASPRLTVLNNQSAVLNVATNRVFFEIDIDVTTDEGTTQTEVDSSIRNVPEGVLVNVLPSINLENSTIAMAVRPTITRVVREIPDPGVQFVTASNGITGVENNVPELNVQEVDTVINMRSGQPVIMGGLLQDTTSSSEDGVPVLNELPLVGNLFKTHTDSVEKSELVIFLKATILENPGDSIHDTDRELYRKFSDDRRPLKM
jgi:general secretion pathway protein D